MITEYFRPDDIDEALRLLKNSPKATFPLGGGTVLSQYDSENFAVVDLQKLKLDKININGQTISWGACVTLQSLVENELSPQALKDSAMREGAINLRRAGTIAGTLVSQKGMSPLGAVLAAMKARVICEPEGISTEINDWAEGLTRGAPSRLITAIEVQNQMKSVYLDISKTPADAPLAYSAMCLDSEGLYRWVIGFKTDTKLLQIEGKETEKLLKNAHSHYNQSESKNSYQNQILNILLERSIIAIDFGRREQ